ncbi:hypothetical protein [Alteromonas lipotrueiana]|uniref:hypothetical protein n=1 Tax=Alteromonas lipotrueiana TaxID=2803815 RepID=UPI001C465F4F|nr:hypothetical protein [Alteromonas lipotrueiana]
MLKDFDEEIDGKDLMATSLQSDKLVQLPVWLSPVAYAVTIAVLQSIFIPTFNAPVITNILTTTFINSVTLLGVLTALFWIALRIIHNKANSAMLEYLLGQNSLSKYAFYRKRTEVRMRNHCIAAFAAAFICFPFVFTVLPDAILPPTLQRMIMLGCLFVAWLYLFQSIGLARFLYRHFLMHQTDSLQKIECQRQVYHVVKTLSRTSMGLLLLLPVCAAGSLHYEQLGIAFSIGLTALLLVVFNVLFSAYQQGKVSKTQSLERLDRKLYFLSRQSKYRKDALNHAAMRLHKEKKALQSCTWHFVSPGAKVGLLLWSIAVPTLWWLVLR